MSTRSWTSPDDRGLLSSARTYAVVLVLFLFIQANGLFSSSLDTIGTTDTAQNSSLALLNVLDCALALALIFRTAPKTLRALFQERLLAFFLILAPVSSLWSDIGWISFRHAFILDVSILFAVWFLGTYSTEQQQTLILWTGSFVALASLALALALPQYGRMATGEWKGVFWHKNQLAQAMELLFSPLFFFRFRSSSQKAAAISVGLLGAALIGFSQSRTGMLLTLMIICLGLFGRLVNRAPLRFRPFIYYSAATFLFVGLPVLFFARDPLLNFLGKTPNLTGRLDTWPVLIPFIFKHPFLGYGISGFWTGYSGASGMALSGMSGAMNTADNGYIDISLQFGFLGLFALLAFLFKALHDFIVVSRWHEVPLSAFWYLALVLDAFLGNISGTFFFQPYGISTTALVLGCVGLSRMKRAGQLQTIQ